MSNNSMMAFRIGTQERQYLKALAEQLERSESDALRFIIRKQAREYGIAPSKTQAPAESRKGENDG